MGSSIFGFWDHSNSENRKYKGRLLDENSFRYWQRFVAASVWSRPTGHNRAGYEYGSGKQLDDCYYLLLGGWNTTWQSWRGQDTPTTSSLLCLSPREVVQERILSATSYCIAPKESDYIFKEIHEGICENHYGPKLLVQKTLCQGYYWPTLIKDAL